VASVQVDVPQVANSLTAIFLILYFFTLSQQVQVCQDAQTTPLRQVCGGLLLKILCLVQKQS